MRFRGLVDTVLDQRLVDVNGNHLAQCQPGFSFLAIGAFELNDFRQLAFERDAAFADARRLDDAARHLRQSGKCEFINLMRHRCGRGVHCLRDVHGGKIPDEFAGLLDITDGVLPGRTGESDQRRMIIERIEEAVGRQIDVALGIT